MAPSTKLTLAATLFAVLVGNPVALAEDIPERAQTGNSTSQDTRLNRVRRAKAATTQNALEALMPFVTISPWEPKRATIPEVTVAVRAMGDSIERKCEACHGDGKVNVTVTKRGPKVGIVTQNRSENVAKKCPVCDGRRSVSLAPVARLKCFDVAVKAFAGLEPESDRNAAERERAMKAMVKALDGDSQRGKVITAATLALLSKEKLVANTAFGGQATIVATSGGVARRRFLLKIDDSDAFVIAENFTATPDIASARFVNFAGIVTDVSDVDQKRIVVVQGGIIDKSGQGR